MASRLCRTLHALKVQSSITAVQVSTPARLQKVSRYAFTLDSANEVFGKINSHSSEDTGMKNCEGEELEELVSITEGWAGKWSGGPF